MGLIESYRRWKFILLNIKKDRKRILENEINLRLLSVRAYSGLENKNMDYKNSLRNQEAKLYSQNGEDGLLMYLVSKIGVETNTMLEIGIGDGFECNSRNFIEHFNWNCWLIDGSDKNTIKINFTDII